MHLVVCICIYHQKYISTFKFYMLLFPKIALMKSHKTILFQIKYVRESNMINFYSGSDILLFSLYFSVCFSFHSFSAILFVSFPVRLFPFPLIFFPSATACIKVKIFCVAHTFRKEQQKLR